MAIPKLNSYSLDNLMLGVENKVDWTLNPDKAVLLIHDMQQYFLDFYADEALKSTLIERVKNIKEACKAQGIPVVYTAQPGDQDPADRALLTDFWGTGLIDDDSITRVVPELAPQADDIVYTKWRYSAFKRSDLLSMMQETGRDQLIIVGVYAHIGCMLTAADAFMYDIQAFFVSDSLGDFSREEHIHALNYVSKRCGFVTTYDDVIRGVQVKTQGTGIPTSKAGLKSQIAAMTNRLAREIFDDENLIESGLEPSHAETLVKGWQHAGLKIELSELTKQPTVNQWWQIIEAKQTK
ncbi:MULTISPECIES: isochorismatase family protein [Vibrio]|uniref:Isochorismatase family protein n=2 Tax=Vibrio TaxID=662 RepID=A0A7X4LP42_9VIBR|nr:MULTISPECIES: isochorismatase family protein [Vibrio]MBF9002468.1 isochorismatase family protein [Vibrio nitrifigilis]MZI95366.1 isochorismatase family protein [Vibrio eleionomae]